MLFGVSGPPSAGEQFGISDIRFGQIAKVATGEGFGMAARDGDSWHWVHYSSPTEPITPEVGPLPEPEGGPDWVQGGVVVESQPVIVVNGPVT